MQIVNRNVDPLNGAPTKRRSILVGRGATGVKNEGQPFKLSLLNVASRRRWSYWSDLNRRPVDYEPVPISEIRKIRDFSLPCLRNFFAPVRLFFSCA